MELRQTDEGNFFWYFVAGKETYLSQMFESPSDAYAARREHRVVWDCYTLMSGGGKL